MASKIKTIIISLVIVGVLIYIYIYFIKKSPDQTNLTTTPAGVTTTTSASPFPTSAPVDIEFLSVLLSVKDIKLNDAIFSYATFNNLRDSSIVLVPDGTEGRKNPFAPIGTDVMTPTNSDLSSPKNTTGNALEIQTGVLPTQKKN